MMQHRRTILITFASVLGALVPSNGHSADKNLTVAPAIHRANLEKSTHSLFLAAYHLPGTRRATGPKRAVAGQW